MVRAAAGNLPEQNQNNKCVNRPPGTAVKKYAGTYDLPCTDIRFHAVKILVELSKVIDSEEILKLLSKMMDDEIADIKIAILTRVRKISGNKKMHNIIYQKGRVDNHYLVRKVAEKYGEESV